ncbi:unnamed protein product [marine sediment metagenome]|uniref:Uncharacterized protein n=1 Tax=marine sediment metagenome TaxID=412755 RepID=X0U9S9_9ZZZZ
MKNNKSMNERDVKAIYWLLGRIENDKILGSFFRHKLNLQYTDLARLIKIFKDLVKMLDNPMYRTDKKILVSIKQNLEIIN